MPFSRAFWRLFLFGDLWFQTVLICRHIWTWHSRYINVWTCFCSENNYPGLHRQSTTNLDGCVNQSQIYSGQSWRWSLNLHPRCIVVSYVTEVCISVPDIHVINLYLHFRQWSPMWFESLSPFQMYSGLSCDWSLHLNSSYKVVSYVMEVSISIPDMLWSPMWLESLSPFEIYSGHSCDWSIHLYCRHIVVKHVIKISIFIPNIQQSLIWLQSPSPVQ